MNVYKTIFTLEAINSLCGIKNHRRTNVRYIDLFLLKLLCAFNN